MRPAISRLFSNAAKVFGANITRVGEQNLTAPAAIKLNPAASFSGSKVVTDAAKNYEVDLSRAFSDQTEQGNKQTVKLVPTNHPVTNPREESLFEKEGGIHTSKKLWHEILTSFESCKKVVKHYRDENVQIGGWLYSDCDRHPDQQKGVITFGSILEKLYIMDGLGIEIQKEIKEGVEQCVKELVNRFDESKKDQSDYHVIVASHSASIAALNNLWDENIEKISQVYTGSDYRVSSANLADPESKSYLNIAEVLEEIKQSRAHVTRLIIADCENVEQLAKAKNLAEKSGINLEVVPLIEDRMKKDDLDQIMEFSAQGKRDLTIMIAGSDSIRRVGLEGVTNLVFMIAQYAELHPELKINLFTGCGNTHFRTENLASMVPSLKGENGEERVNVERTVQGELFHSLTNKKFAEDFLKEQQDKLENRPTIDEAREVYHLYQDLDGAQKKFLEEVGNNPVLKSDLISAALNFTKVFGSRHKPNKFKEEAVSQNDLLNNARAIEHAWVWQLTGAVSFGVKELHHYLQNENSREEILEHKDNPYVKNMMVNAIKNLYYCDKDLAAKYYHNSETLENDFKKADLVTGFVKDNFPDLYEARHEIMKNEFKYYRETVEDFKGHWEEFRGFRDELAKDISSELGGDKVNHRVKMFYHTKNPVSISQNVGRNFSTMAERSPENGLVEFLERAGLALNNDQQAKDDRPQASTSAIGAKSLLAAERGKSV